MNKKTIRALNNPTDSDAGASRSDKMVYEFSDSDEEWSKENQSLDSLGIIEENSEKEREMETPQYETNNIEAEKNVDSEQMKENQKPFDSKQEQPTTTVKALRTSELAKKYKCLVDRILQITELQKKTLTNIDQLCELDTKLLEAKIKIKEVKLRSKQFTPNEQILLVTLADKYKDVVENKQTDFISLQEKTQVWSNIAAKFNASLFTSTPRSVTALQNWYTNRKKKLKRLVADGRLDMRKMESSDKLLLSIMNKKTIRVLNNPTDSDAGASHSDDMVYEFSDSDEEWSEENQSLDSLGIIEENSEIEREMETPQYETDNIETEKNVDSEQMKENQEAFDSKQEQPTTTVKALRTSELTEKYKCLVDRILEITELQKKTLTNIDQLCELDTKLLEAKIKIKEVKLQKLLKEV